MNFIRVSAAMGILLCVGCKHLEPRSQSKADKTETNAPLVFQVSFPASVRSETATGRLLLFLSQTASEPRNHIDWMDFDPVYAVDVTNLAPNAVVEMKPRDFRRPDALAFPMPLSRLAPGEYTAQLLLDLDNTARDWNDGPGNLFSAPQHCWLKGGNG